MGHLHIQKGHRWVVNLPSVIPKVNSSTEIKFDLNRPKGSGVIKTLKTGRVH